MANQRPGTPNQDERGPRNVPRNSPASQQQHGFHQSRRQQPNQQQSQRVPPNPQQRLNPQPLGPQHPGLRKPQQIQQLQGSNNTGGRHGLKRPNVPYVQNNVTFGGLFADQPSRMPSPQIPNDTQSLSAVNQWQTDPLAHLRLPGTQPNIPQQTRVPNNQHFQSLLQSRAPSPSGLPQGPFTSSNPVSVPQAPGRPFKVESPHPGAQDWARQGLAASSRQTQNVQRGNPPRRNPNTNNNAPSSSLNQTLPPSSNTNNTRRAHHDQQRPRGPQQLPSSAQPQSQPPNQRGAAPTPAAIPTLQPVVTDSNNPVPTQTRQRKRKRNGHGRGATPASANPRVPQPPTPVQTSVTSSNPPTAFRAPQVRQRGFQDSDVQFIGQAQRQHQQQPQPAIPQTPTPQERNSVSAVGGQDPATRNFWRPQSLGGVPRTPRQLEKDAITIVPVVLGTGNPPSFKEQIIWVEEWSTYRISKYRYAPRLLKTDPPPQGTYQPNLGRGETDYSDPRDFAAPTEEEQDWVWKALKPTRDRYTKYTEVDLYREDLRMLAEGYNAAWDEIRRMFQDWLFFKYSPDIKRTGNVQQDIAREVGQEKWFLNGELTLSSVRYEEALFKLMRWFGLVEDYVYAPNWPFKEDLPKVENDAGKLRQNPDAFACKHCCDNGINCWGHRENENRICTPCERFQVRCSKEQDYQAWPLVERHAEARIAAREVHAQQPDARGRKRGRPADDEAADERAAKRR
ncbi:hypothetical protein LTR64_007215 [Lithohypha guttulata]|uniref:uncharacterized protein n=1 Tax=Lithohypha guttulata TaxID=1690604 RepID=UPI002DE18B7F|nr:hypothetical protein LTR51_004229 [Lithohypha guttulata]